MSASADEPNSGGVTCHEPGLCHEGYTLFSLAGGDRFHLIDMAGEVVHSWPAQRSDLGELQPDGSLICGENYTAIREIDWHGKVLWSFPCTWHHDFAVTGDRVMVLCGGREKVFDRPDVFEGCREGLSFIPNYFLEFDVRTFARTWLWSAHEHIQELRAAGVRFPRPVDERSKHRWGDIFHCNTLEVLPDTALGRRDERFRAGNVLFSYRQVDVIGVVDRGSGRIVWAYGPGELDGQHQPTLIPDADPITGREMPGAGHILIFDNGRYWRDWSRVVEIDPASDAIVWSSPSDWHSWHISGAQRLPNGNTFICDGPAGRLFEITPEGRTVWEYHSPFAKHRGPGEPAQGAAHDDIGGTDTPRAIYRATRYPKAFVEDILRRQADESAGGR